MEDIDRQKLLELVRSNWGFNPGPRVIDTTTDRGKTHAAVASWLGVPHETRSDAPAAQGAPSPAPTSTPAPFDAARDETAKRLATLESNMARALDLMEKMVATTTPKASEEPDQ